jgi:autotransporter-associated beta strand protein
VTFSIFAAVTSGANTPATQNFTVDLLAGTAVAGAPATGASLSGNSLSQLETVSDGGTLSTTWQEFTVNFTATSIDTTIWIYDSSTAVASDGNDIILDDVSITAVAPPGDITWGAATSVSASSDVSTTGVLVEAFNAGDNAVLDQTVNTVLFTGTGALLPLNTANDVFSGDTGDAAYNALLSSIDFGGGGNLFTISVGNGNLVVGEEYLIQVWFVDTSAATRVMQFGDGNGNTVGLAASPGQFATGTFTATNTDQTLSLFATNFGNAHITAYQIRDTSVLGWDGSTDSTWTNPDSTSWSGETYDDGDDVSFAGTGAGTVTLSGSVAPGSVAVDATADYTFTGDDISGATGLTKSGTGTLTLASANTYTGVTTISGGILTVGHNAALGDVAGNTVVSGGSLRMEGGISLAEPLDISGGNKEAPALWNAAGNNTVTGAITGAGRIQTDAGTLTLSGGLTHTGDGSITGDFVVDTTPFSVAGAMKFSGDSYNIGDPEYVAGRTIVLNPITGTHDWDYTRIWFSALVELGANDIMPTDTDVLFGWSTVANSLARLDLKSFDQTVASIVTSKSQDYVGGDVEITDSTGSGTLTVNQTTATEYQGRFTGGLALIKSGAGTLTLNNLSGTATSHTGATTVAAGTLSLLTDITASAMTVNSGASLELTLGTSVTSSALTLDGGSTVKVIGTPTLASYTLITASSISGTPVLDAAIAGYELVVNGLSLELNEVAGYTSWAAGYPGLTDTDSTLDFDGGSLETGLEYVLASDPTDASDDLTVAPTSTYTGTALEFDYRRSDVANDDPSTTIEVEYNSDLATSWTTAEDGVAGVSITVNDDFYGAGIDQVVVSLPESLAPESKLFARLKVTMVP